MKKKIGILFFFLIAICAGYGLTAVVTAEEPITYIYNNFLAAGSRGEQEPIEVQLVEIEYKDNNMTVEFKEDGVKIGKAVLKSHKTYDEIKEIVIGQRKTVVWYEFSEFETVKENAIVEVEFIDLRKIVQGKENPSYLQPINKDYNLVYMEKEEWKSYNSSDIPDKNTLIGVQVDMGWGELIDVRMNILGNSLEKHAVVIGVSAGFLETAPTADPGGTGQSSAGKISLISDTLPATAITITEIGAYVWGNAIHEYEVGIYDDNGTGGPGDLIGTVGGPEYIQDLDENWYVIDGLSINVSAHQGTTLWIAYQVDTNSVLNIDKSQEVGTKNAWKDGESIPDPLGVIDGQQDDYIKAIYALWNDIPTQGNDMTVSVQNPEGITLSPNSTIDGNYPVDFNVQLSINTETHAEIYYSSSTGTYENLIVDLNLLDGAVNPTTDFNCTQDVNFENPINCFYDFNFSTATDGSYFIDVNAYLMDGNTQQSSGEQFTIDFLTPPDVNITMPVGITIEDANTIDGNFAIDFNAQATESGELKIALYYSQAQGGRENLIVDYSLTTAGSSPTEDVNCTGGGSFTTSQRCFYDFNFDTVNDGSYYIDANIYQESAENYQESGGQFTIDLDPGAQQEGMELPITDTFEVADSNWTDETISDNCQWERDSLGTPSTGTGPQPQGSAKAAMDTTWYMYIETSAGGYPDCSTTGHEAWLISPYIEFGDYETMDINFYYYMYGATISTLSLDENTSGSWVTIWTLSGDQGQTWVNVDQNLNDVTGNGHLRFRAVRGSSYTGDITIDEIRITGTKPGEEPTESTCNVPASGSWIIDNGDDCTIDDSNRVSAGHIIIEDGTLTITSTGTMVLDSGYELIIADEAGNWYYQESGGNLLIEE